MRRYLFCAASMIGMLALGCATSPQQIAASPTAADTTVRTGPISAETHFAAGQLAESQNKLQSSIDQYQAALAINPSHLASLYRLAVVYAELKQYPQSIEVWNRYVVATNHAAAAYGDLGFCQELAGQASQAEASYQAGIARDPKCVPCRVNYGLMLARSGRFKDAISQWQVVLSQAEIHYNLGSIYAAQGRKEEARYEFERALQLDPKLVEAKTRVTALDQE